MGPRNDKHCGNPDAQRCCEESTAPLRRIITFAMLRLRVRSPSAPVRGKQDRGAMRLSTGCMLVYTKCGNAAFPAARGQVGQDEGSRAVSHFAALDLRCRPGPSAGAVIETAGPRSESGEAGGANLIDQVAHRLAP